MLEGPDGNMWLWNNSFFKVSLSGTTLATYSSGIGGGSSICTDGSSIFAAATSGSYAAISKCTLAGTITNYVQSPGSYAGGYQLTYGPDGRVWQAWVDSLYLEGAGALSSGGAWTKYPQTSGAYYNIATDGTYIWIFDVAYGRLRQLTTSGVNINTYTLTGYTGGSPPGMCYDAANSCFWIVDYAGPPSKIWKVTTSGVITSTNTSATRPWGIATDGTTLWWTDYAGTQAFSAPCSNPASETGHTLPGATQPYAVAIDSLGGVYVSDGGSSNSVFKYNATATTQLCMII